MIGVALRLITENDALAHITHGLPDFGKATVIAGTEYDDLAVEKLFLSSTDPLKARDRTEYESAGREALKYLISLVSGKVLCGGQQTLSIQCRGGNLSGKRFELRAAENWAGAPLPRFST